MRNMANTTDIVETRLDNGLKVLTKEVHHAPIVSLYLWYRVGGRNERPGITGISHWAEHMLFKGTPTLKKGDIGNLVETHGGSWNGFTWVDFTAYFETLPSQHLDLAIRIESDRLANALFDPDEVESERTVIISEREGAENQPFFHLHEETTAAAFKVHPYGQPVVGWKSDLRQITREDLYDYYRTYYTPNNGIAVAVGDFDTADLLQRVEDAFGPIPAGPSPPPVRSEEPPQEGERRVTVRRPGPVPSMLALYHIPALSHPDAIPLQVAASVLGAGRSARLYKAIVNQGLATRAHANADARKDPGLFSVSVSLRRGAATTEAEEVALREVERLGESAISDAELAKVRRQVRSWFLMNAEGVSRQARLLGQFEVEHTWQAYSTYLDDLDAVTPADVARVARTYLRPDNRTVGWFLPTRPQRQGRHRRQRGNS